jgi:hypothetical protein
MEARPHRIPLSPPVFYCHHSRTMQFVQHRVADNRILRLIQKWLKAGVTMRLIRLPELAAKPRRTTRRRLRIGGALRNLRPICRVKV